MVAKDLILSVLDTEGTIEDIFSLSDFKKFVLEEENNEYTEKNSTYVKKEKWDKVLIAKKFLETCQNKTKISLDQTTMKNITNLFDNIEKKF